MALYPLPNLLMMPHFFVALRDGEIVFEESWSPEKGKRIVFFFTKKVVHPQVSVKMYVAAGYDHDTNKAFSNALIASVAAMHAHHGVHIGDFSYTKLKAARPAFEDSIQLFDQVSSCFCTVGVQFQRQIKALGDLVSLARNASSLSGCFDEYVVCLERVAATMRQCYKDVQDQVAVAVS